jgi:hypothetical protein
MFYMHFIELQHGQFHVALSSKFSKDINDIAITDIIIITTIIIYFYLFSSSTLHYSRGGAESCRVKSHVHAKLYICIPLHLILFHIG